MDFVENKDMPLCRLPGGRSGALPIVDQPSGISRAPVLGVGVALSGCGAGGVRVVGPIDRDEAVVVLPVIGQRITYQSGLSDLTGAFQENQKARTLGKPVKEYGSFFAPVWMGHSD